MEKSFLHWTTIELSKGSVYVHTKVFDLSWKRQKSWHESGALFNILLLGAYAFAAFALWMEPLERVFYMTKRIVLPFQFPSCCAPSKSWLMKLISCNIAHVTNTFSLHLLVRLLYECNVFIFGFTYFENDAALARITEDVPLEGKCQDSR